MKQHKKILLIILLAASALAVLGLSFQVGKMLSRAYRETTAPAPAQESLKRGTGVVSQTAAAPKAESPAVKEAAESGTVDSGSKMVPAPAPGPVGKADTPAPKKDAAQRPAETAAAPVGKSDKAEKPAETAKPAVAAMASSVAPASKDAKAPKPAEATKPAAATTASTATAPPATKRPEPAPPAATASPSTVRAAAKPPEPAPEQKPEAETRKNSKEYKVVAESFAAEAEAGKLADRLKAEHYQPVVVPADLPKKGRYYRVIVGSHGSLNEARAQMTDLKKMGLQPFLIVE